MLGGNKIEWRTKIAPFFLFLITFFTYFYNLSSSVYGGDVGDLVTTAYVGGVAHPPGYPLFTLLGFLLTKLSFGQTPAFMVGLISVFSSSIAVVIFYLLILKLTKNILVSLISALVLAFSFLFWFYAEIAEVFALNNLFAILLFYLAVLFRENKSVKTFFLFCFVLGLSLTNHHTIILVFPALVILVFPTFINIIRKKPRIIPYGILFSLLGFSVYLYVPIASSKNPVINWDSVKDLQSFFHLLLRRDYGTFKAGIFETPVLGQRIVILKTYLINIALQLTLPVIFLSLLGCIKLYLKDRLLFISLACAFIISGPVFLGYAGFPLYGAFFLGIYERFFVLSSIFVIILFSFGLLFFSDFIGRFFRKKYTILFRLVFLIIPFLLFYYNFSKTNLSNIWLGDEIAYDLISSLPENSALFLTGDTILFNAWYVHYARGLRPDVRIINVNGLAGDKYLKKEIKEIVKNKPSLKKREKEGELIGEAIRQIQKKRPVFAYPEIQPIEKPKFLWIPYGLTYKLISTSSAIPSEEDFLKQTEALWQEFHTPYFLNRKNLAYGSLSIADIPFVYSNALLATGSFVLKDYKDKEKALEFYKKAILIDPNYSKPYEILGVYYLSAEEKCNLAETNFLKAIELDPYQKMPYYFLYAIYKECLKNYNKAVVVVRDFEKIFMSNFLKDLNDQMNKK